VQRIGPYELMGELGRGGAGVIYRARDPGLRRDVAIKLLSGRRSHTASSLGRFQREAEALARLRHPHVVKVHSAGQHEGLPYLVMDLIEGRSLAGRIADDGPLPVPEALTIALRLSRALEHVHRHSLLHRDLKPDNVLLNRDGEPLLTDFGLAKDQEAERALSREGALLGTPGYWPPEQARGQLDAIGPTADIYALGATLYAMLTGAPPVQEKSIPELLVATCEVVPDPPSTARPDVPPAVDAVCARCLEKSPRNRYPDAAALSAALEAALEGRSPQATSPQRLLLQLLASLLVVTAIAGWLAARARTANQPAPPPGSALAPDPETVLADDPALALSLCLDALAAGEDRGEIAAAALSSLATVPEPVFARLEALPPSDTRRRLQVLACLLAGRDGDAAAAAAAAGTRMRLATQVAREARGLHESIDDGALLTGAPLGPETTLALERLLEQAERLAADQDLDPIGHAARRRCQSGLAHVLVRLRAVQPLDVDLFEADLFARARQLAPDSREASYLDVAELWVLLDDKDRRHERYQAVLLRLVAATPDAGWEPLFVFLRGFLLLEVHGPTGESRVDMLPAGELAYQAAPDVPALRVRYGRQWMGLRWHIAAGLVLQVGPTLLRSRGTEGREDLVRAYRLAIASLLGPAGDEDEAPPLELVDAAWLRRLDVPERVPAGRAPEGADRQTRGRGAGGRGGLVERQRGGRPRSPGDALLQPRGVRDPRVLGPPGPHPSPPR
jgi:hypothetical protein